MENDIVKMLFLQRQRQKKRSKIKTISGAPPLTYKAAAGALKDYRIYGNTVDGESVGDRTGNLWSEKYEGATLHYVPIKVEDGEYTLSTTIPNAGAPGGAPAANIFLLPGNVNSGASTSGNGCWLNNPKTVQSIDGYVTVAYKATESFGEKCYPWNNKTMLNSGSTPLPYEPCGYKVPVTVSNGTDTQIVPIYIPEQIRKVGDYSDYIDYESQKFVHIVVRKVFDGTENIRYYGPFGTYRHNHFYFDFDASAQLIADQNTTAPVSNKYISYASIYVNGIGDRCVRYKVSNSEQYIYDVSRIYFTDDSVSNAEDFKTMLADWYTNGDPLVVDHIVAMPVEETVTLPTLPTLAGTNVFTVGTAVQPSEVRVVGKIKEI